MLFNFINNKNMVYIYYLKVEQAKSFHFLLVSILGWNSVPIYKR